MKFRRIGRSELEIAPLMLGGNVFGWTCGEAESFAILDAFVGSGFNAIDTADVYSTWVPGHVGGESETIIGKWLKARGGRARLVLASKVGAKAAQPGEMETGRDLSATHIVAAVEESLRRLQTDYLDLYQSHNDDPATPLDETLEAFDRLIRSGKVRAIGASHYGPVRLSAALALSAGQGLPRYESYQPRYNLCDRAGFEGPLQEVCLSNDVAILAYSALAKGFLTGAYRSAAEYSRSQWATALSAYADERGIAILSALEKVAAEQGAGMGAVSLAWLLAQPGVAAAVVAVNDPGELNPICAAADLELSASQLATLTTVSAAMAEPIRASLEPKR